jgi:uncharacterized protein YbaR (Trm112 family)/ubiquinone/menaquinone biosynthesis C-methylase UbiE
MKPSLMSLLACPACRGDLSLYVIPQQGGGQAVRLTEMKQAPDDIDVGVLVCAHCEGVYPICDGIPRLVLPGFASGPSFLELLGDLARGLPASVRDRFSRQGEATDTSKEATWARAEMNFWDESAYPGEKEHVGLDRIHPRRKFLFAELGKTGKPAVIVEVGCGRAESTSACIDLDDLGARYLGIDLAVSGLKVAKTRIPKGEFVQASITHLPLKKEIADWVLCFGTLHHLPGHELQAAGLLDLLRPGGVAAFHESAARQPGFSRFPRLAKRFCEPESEHEEHIDVASFRSLLESRGTLVFYRVEHSALKTWLVRLTGRWMAKSTTLVDLVDGIDQLAIHTLGRVVGFMGAGGVMAVVRR